MIPIGTAGIARPGADLTIATIGKSVSDALAAADTLAAEGVDAEVIDLRCLRPLDVDTVLESVSRTHRLLAVEEGPMTGGWASGLLGAVAAAGLHELDDAWLLTTAETPIPYSPTLEDAFIPDTAAIVASGARTRRRGSPLMAPHISYVDPATVSDPELQAIMERARTLGTPRPESQAIRLHHPEVMKAFNQAWEVFFRQGVCDHAIKELCRLYISKSVQCEYCGGQRSVLAQQQGTTEAQVDEILNFEDSDRFDDREKTALEWALRDRLGPDTRRR